MVMCVVRSCNVDKRSINGLGSCWLGIDSPQTPTKRTKGEIQHQESRQGSLKISVFSTVFTEFAIAVDHRKEIHKEPSSIPEQGNMSHNIFL